MLVLSDPPPISSTCPSPGIPATCCAAMVPPAPGLFTTTSGCGNSGCAASMMARAIRSAPPPGAKPMMHWIGRVGAQALRACRDGRGRQPCQQVPSMQHRVLPVRLAAA